jgi:PPM family protein phosphatase
VTREGEGAAKTAHQLPAVEFAQRTDAGRDPQKQINEDTCRYGETRLGHLAVTCDGMGGHEGGREASRVAVETVFEVVDAASSEARPADVLREAIALANTNVRGLAEIGHEASRPGSTIVAVLLNARGAEIAHVGDSRIYMTHGADVVQLTHDHSMVQQMVDAGLIAQEEAAAHPNANQISRALGMKVDVDVELRPTPVAFVAGDAFVLCTDGLSDLVSVREILEIVGSGPPAQAVGQLVDLANARGGHDNITVQVLRARESAIAVSDGTGAVAPTVADTIRKTVVDAGSGATQVEGEPRSTYVPPHPSSLRRDVLSSSDDGEGHPRRSPAVILGLVLALAGLGVAGGLVWLMGHKPTKKVPVFVDPPGASASASTAAPGNPLPPEPSEEPSLAPLLAPGASSAPDARAPARRHHDDPSGAPTPIAPPVPIPTDHKIEW